MALNRRSGLNLGDEYLLGRLLGRILCHNVIQDHNSGNTKGPPRKRFSKMISLNAKNLESVLLAEPQLAVMFPCRTLTRSAKVSCRTLRLAEPKALNSEKDYLAEPWNAGSFRKCPTMSSRNVAHGVLQVGESSRGNTNRGNRTESL